MSTGRSPSPPSTQITIGRSPSPPSIQITIGRSPSPAGIQITVGRSPSIQITVGRSHTDRTGERASDLYCRCRCRCTCSTYHMHRPPGKARENYEDGSCIYMSLVHYRELHVPYNKLNLVCFILQIPCCTMGVVVGTRYMYVAG